MRDLFMKSEGELDKMRDRLLSILFPKQPELANDWLHTANKALGGEKPINCSRTDVVQYLLDKLQM